MKKSYNTGNVIGGILIGTLFGVALRMLFTSCRCDITSLPEGDAIDIKDLRKKMQKEASELRKKAEELEGLTEE